MPVEPPTTAKLSAFSDGLKTRGQAEPIYELLQPYEKYPQEITGPTVWKAEDYRDNPERWTHQFSDAEIEELSKAADDFISSGVPLTGITKVRTLYLGFESSALIMMDVDSVPAS